jgi:hypothetical protein
MPAGGRVVKPKKCSNCKAEFIPARPLQRVCTLKCAVAIIKKKRELAQRKKNRIKRQELKTKSDLLKEAQTEFNKFIRLRDKDLPCVSCGRHHNGQYQAGHYKTVGGFPELRFTELNCAKQCSHCNKWKSGAIVGYRIELVKRIGLDKVEWLEGQHDPLKLSREEIIDIKKKYREKWKQLEEAK